VDTTENLEAVDEDRRLVSATASGAVRPFHVNFLDVTSISVPIEIG
jgi:hypothetical protein